MYSESRSCIRVFPISLFCLSILVSSLQFLLFFSFFCLFCRNWTEVCFNDARLFPDNRNGTWNQFNPLTFYRPRGQSVHRVFFHLDFSPLSQRKFRSMDFRVALFFLSFFSSFFLSSVGFDEWKIGSAKQQAIPRDFYFFTIFGRKFKQELYMNYRTFVWVIITFATCHFWRTNKRNHKQAREITNIAKRVAKRNARNFHGCRKKGFISNWTFRFTLFHCCA